MHKKSLLVFLTSMTALSACGTLEVTVERTVITDPTQPAQVEATVTPEPTPKLTQSVPETPAPEPFRPYFSSISFFTVSPQATANCRERYSKVFPARVRQIHARWDYANMRDGLMIRREWYKDGVPWFQREQPWDFARYGANGTIRDISIYDFDAGLEPGNYELRLHIDGQPQSKLDTENSFVIDKDWSLEIASPNGRLTALTADPQKLMIREADGTKWELLAAHEISSLVWFPDSRHIAYTDTDRSQAIACSSIGIRHTLWIVDAATGKQHQIGTVGENLHNPLVSPDGHYIAARTGSGWGDACFVDLDLVFIELDGNLQQVRALNPKDFTGFPAEPPDADGEMMYPKGIGTWQDNTHFETGFSWTCSRVPNLGGIYLFDLAGGLADRTGDLPNP